MISVSIRDAVVSDVPGIQDVAQRSWTAAYGDFLPEDLIEAILDDWYIRPQLEVPITSEGTVYLVAATDENICGFASAAPTNENEAQIYSIYVTPTRWNRGTGTKLLDAVIDRLQDSDVERLRVEVLADNEVGVSFYESRGFERVTERNVLLGDQTRSEYVYYRDI